MGEQARQSPMACCHSSKFCYDTFTHPLFVGDKKTAGLHRASTSAADAASPMSDTAVLAAFSFLTQSYQSWLLGADVIRDEV